MNNPDLLSMLVNVGVIVEPLIKLVQTVAGLMGLFLVGTGLMTFWEAANENSQKNMTAQSSPPSVAGGVVRIFVGACLIATASLEVVYILSRTLTDGYANSRFLSYSPVVGGTLAEQAKLARQTLFGIMQVVGLIAIIKGWWTLNERFNARTNSGIGTACAWLLGGVLCWNFEWFGHALNNTIGFDMIGLFNLGG